MHAIAHTNLNPTNTIPLTNYLQQKHGLTLITSNSPNHRDAGVALIIDKSWQERINKVNAKTFPGRVLAVEFSRGKGHGRILKVVAYPPPNEQQNRH